MGRTSGTKSSAHHRWTCGTDRPPSRRFGR